jgi:hypothetical protein
VAKLADALVSGISDRKVMRVQVPPCPPFFALRATNGTPFFRDKRQDSTRHSFATSDKMAPHIVATSDKIAHAMSQREDREECPSKLYAKKDRSMQISAQKAVFCLENVVM